MNSISSVRLIKKLLENVTKFKTSGNRFLSATIENSPYDLHRLDTGPPTSAELTKEDALKYLKTMFTIRNMEKEISELYKSKLIRGFCHLYSGQESVGVGINSVMQPQDTAITSYRCHGWMLLMGGTVQEVVAELLGVKTGCARGKGGSMHMYTSRLFGGNGIVGAHVPLGTGIAMAHKYRNDKGVCVTLYGDGASNQGQSFEAMNIAMLKSLPVLYIAENNIYAMGTSVQRHSSNPNLYTKGGTVPGIRLDGMDILSVRECAKFALDYVRGGNGPLILETVTYRYFGHSMSDPGTSYRSREEVQKVRETKDPIRLLKGNIISSQLAAEDDLAKLEKEVKVQIANAIKEVRNDTEVGVEEVAYDIYCSSKSKVTMPGYNKYIEHKNAGVIKPLNVT